ncbi:MAG: sulfotransferase [Kangiella sp.]|nr:sulfotransferase [Kangiella sp.]
MTLPNALIAGTGRAGSTSLFRYLAAHPDVCGSLKKELQFFNTYKEDSGIHLDEYESNFSHCAKSHKVIIEATPHYLLFGKEIAHIIARTLPRVKLIFILREPVERLYTVYRNENNIDSQLTDITFDKYVDLAINGAGNNKSELESRFNYYLNTGCYAQQLAAYYDHFDANQIRVFFFDDFKKDTPRFVNDVCDFLDIDANFYRSYNFTVENKTRAFKNLKVHKLAYLMNRSLEKYLNSMPRLRQRLRSLYMLLNERTKRNNHMSDNARDTLTNFYRPYNQELRKLLCKQSNINNLPAWLGDNI